jgi:hypothetical protein
MFGWLRKKTDFELYGPDEKKIFSYWNGERTVKADPLVLFKRYSEKRLELSRDLVLAKSMHSDADKGHSWAMSKIREVFAIKEPPNLLEPWKDQTLGEDELGNLLVKFLQYIDSLKKNSSDLPIQSNFMEDYKSSSNEDPPMNNSADSGSTPSGWSIGTPQPLPKVLESQPEVLNPASTTGLP